VQVTTVTLRRGARYLVRVRPAGAEIQIRRRSRDTTTAQPLLASAAPESLMSWRAFRVTTAEAGEHFVELTNPGIGATLVRVSLLSRAPGDTAATIERRTLVFSENVSGGPSFVTLDSGVVYRFIAVGSDVLISPRVLYRTPLRAAPMVHPGPTGTPFIPEFTGEYRLDAVGDASVRIYREEMDAVQLACLRNPRGPGCLASRRRGGTKLGVVLALVSVPIIIVIMLIQDSQWMP